MDRLSVEQLRSRVEKIRRMRGDALIDVAHVAKIHPSTVGRFERGQTACPTWLTRWGLRKYIDQALPNHA